MEEKPDLISSLPEEIIRSIICFLPLKLAVRTSILSNVWRNLWKPTFVNLDSGLYQITSHEASKEVTQIIGAFLTSRDGPLKLCVGSHKYENELSKMKDERIILATKVVEEELHLDFFEEEEVIREFKLVLDTNCSNLEKTSILASLKTLHLRSVTHLSENIIPTLFSNCPLLESLKLAKCSGLQCLDIKASDRFESFEMVECPKVANVSLWASNLKSFRYSGVLSCIQIKNASHLVDVMLDFRDRPSNNEFDCEEVLSLLAALKDVEILTICGWLLEWLCSAGVIFGHLEFQFNNLKELWWIGSSIDKPKRDSMACFLNITPFLERLFIDIDPQLNSIPHPVFCHYWHEPHLWMDYTTVKSNALPLERLKIVTIAGFTNQDDGLLLIDLLLKKAVTLKSMTVKSPQNHPWQVVKIPRSQLEETSRNQWKKISILSLENEYFYGYTEEDCSGLSPAHAQNLSFSSL